MNDLEKGAMSIERKKAEKIVDAIREMPGLSNKETYDKHVNMVLEFANHNKSSVSDEEINCIITKMETDIRDHQLESGFSTVFDFLHEDLEDLRSKLNIEGVKETNTDGWVSVDTSMPKHEQWALAIIYHQDKFWVPFTAKWDTERQVWISSCEDDECGGDNITHWRPLPKNPLKSKQ